MADEVFVSQRVFQLWGYTASHCRLLLRSTKDAMNPTRIDVEFGGVTRMLIRPRYNGLRIVRASGADVAVYRDRFGELAPDDVVFTLGAGLDSFVIAGNVQSHEDEGRFVDPSYFGNYG